MDAIKQGEPLQFPNAVLAIRSESSEKHGLAIRTIRTLRGGLWIFRCIAPTAGVGEQVWRQRAPPGAWGGSSAGRFDRQSRRAAKNRRVEFVKQ